MKRIRGIIFTAAVSLSLVLCVATVALSFSGQMTLTYSATFYDNPPPGFIDTTIAAPVSGSWKWEAAEAAP